MSLTIIYIILFLIVLFILGALFKHFNSQKKEKNENVIFDYDISKVPIKPEDKEKMQKLDKFIKDKLEEYSKMCKKMGVKKFIDFLNRNDEKGNINLMLEHLGYKINFFLGERVNADGKGTKYLLRVTKNKANINRTLDEVADLIDYGLPNTIFKSDRLNYDIVYNLALKNSGTMFPYTFTFRDPITGKMMLRSSYCTLIKEGDFTGVLGLGYNLLDVSDIYVYNYASVIKKSYIVLSCLIIFISGLLLTNLSSSLNSTILNMFVFMVCPLVYIFNYLFIEETFSSLETENNKLEKIDNGILSVSFLISVNIFIITQSSLMNFGMLQKKNIFLQSIIIFSTGLIFLLMSVYKSTDYDTIQEMRELRVSKQLAFNIVLYYNIFMIINYVTMIFYKHKAK
jgi:hypothetical protein